MTETVLQHSKTETSSVVDKDMAQNFETLRCILERQQSRTVSYDEAQDVGVSLLSFFELLATPSDAEMCNGE